MYQEHMQAILLIVAWILRSHKNQGGKPIDLGKAASFLLILRLLGLVRTSSAGLRTGSHVVVNEMPGSGHVAVWEGPP